MILTQSVEAMTKELTAMKRFPILALLLFGVHGPWPVFAQTATDRPRRIFWFAFCYRRIRRFLLFRLYER